METIVQNQSENKPTIIEDVNRPHEFQLYVLWKSIPYYFKNPPVDKRTGTAPSALDFMLSLGIDDDDLLEVGQLRNQGEFAVKYGINKDTLTHWNKKIALRNPLEDVQNWAKRLSKNVVMAMYNNALSKNLNADKDRLNFLKVTGWTELTRVEMEAGQTLAGLLRASLAKKAIESTKPKTDGQ